MFRYAHIEKAIQRSSQNKNQLNYESHSGKNNPNVIYTGISKFLPGCNSNLM